MMMMLAHIVDVAAINALAAAGTAIEVFLC
jgi:hypothetical protein